MRKILLLLLFPFAMFAQEPYHGVPPAAATWLSTNGTLAGPWNPLTGAAGTDPYIGTPRAAGIYYSSTGTQAGPWYPCTLTICFGGGGSTLSLTSPTSTLTLSPSPITGTGTLDLNLAHANTWTGQQTFVTPALGTPASGVLTNATGLPAASVLTGALANGMTATTQTTGDNTTKVATDAFVLANGGTSSYTNVVASSSADTTVALINAKCTGGQTYVASIPLSIATGGTINSGCVVSHWAGGVWTIASGQTVTFANPYKEIGAPSAFFAGAGTVVLAAQDASSANFGTVNDGNYSAKTGTDNAAAFQACINALTNGHCVVPVGAYLIGSTISITQSFVSMKAAQEGWGFDPIGGTLIFTNSASADLLDIHGTNGSTVIYGNELSGLLFARTAQPTGTAAGVSLWFTQGLRVNNVISCDSIYDFDYQLNWGGILDAAVGQYTCGAFAYAGSPTLYAHHATGQSGTTYLNNSSGNVIGSVSSAIVYGFYGSGLVDFNLTSFSSSGATWGEYYTGASQDITSIGSISDTNTQGCFKIDGNPTTITIQPKWCNSSGPYGVYLDSVGKGASILNGVFFQAGTTASIYAHASSPTISNNVITTRNSSNVVGILMDASIFSTVSGNHVEGFSTTGVAYEFINDATSNTFLSNTARSANGIVSSGAFASFDLTSCANVAANLNTWDTGAFTGGIADTCGTNSFSSGISGATSGQALIAGSATTATSSKALAGSGAGITTGPTTSTNTDCASFNGTTGQIQDAGAPCGTGGSITLTTLGSSGAATYAAGILNIPVYSGGGLTPVTVTVSALTEVDFISGTNACINGTNNNYDILFSLKLNGGTAVDPRIQVHASGSYDTGSNYSQGRSFVKVGANSTPAGSGSTGTGFSLLGDPGQSDNSGSYFAGTIHLIGVNLTSMPTHAITGQWNYFSAGGSQLYMLAVGGDWATGGTAYDGFRFFIDGTQTMTGTITCQPLAQ